MFTPYLPYPDSSGGQIRTQNLLKHLRKKHDITLFSLIKYKKEEEYIPILEKNFCKKVRVFYRSEKPWMIQNILRTGFSLNPFLVVRNFSSEAKKAVEEELKTGDYDLIHAETFYAMPHIPKTNLPVVLVDQTIEYQVYDHYVRHTALFFVRPLLAIDVAKLKYWERYYWREASKVIAVSEKDRQEMLAVEPRLDVDIVPNGVNLDLFKKKTSWSSESPIIMFMGNFNWLQNTEAAMLLIDEIFPIIKKEIKTAKLHIVGQHQPESLLRKASQDILLSNLAEDDIDGIVKANYEASVSASPLRGPGGTRLKVLAAMASKLPIVSSNVGVTGLGVKSGREVIIENDSREMAQAIISILKNPKNAQKLAESAYNFVVNEYDYAVITEKLSQIYLSLKNK
ncbi:glycosyltransferase family 4 protein [Candidatus Collierbacteria bacterium]|nr:glycosyltransferase family 4 protein [Candidatus Collierbacteria bacterium]